VASKALTKRLAVAAALRERERGRRTAKREAILARRREMELAAEPEEMEAEAEVEVEKVAERPVARVERASEVALERAAPPTVQRIEIHDPDRSSWMVGLAVGFGVVAVLGLGGVILYLLLRKKDGNLAGPEFRIVPYPMAMGQFAGAPTLEATPLPATAAPSLPVRRTAPGLVTRSFRLPSLTDYESGAVRIGQATDVEYEAIVRTVGPAGEWAVISFNPTELMQPGMSNFPVGDVLVLPSGQWQKMRLLPRQVLYAKGSVDEVVVSVTLNERQAG
jgi:hypothetical protein